MLVENHPHAWDVNHADRYLDPKQREDSLPPGGHLVVTPKMRQLVSNVPYALRRNQAIAISGPVGAGKTTLLHAITAVADVRVRYVELPADLKNTTQYWRCLARAVTEAEPSGTTDQMLNDCREYLAKVPTLLIVDEAQHLPLESLLQVRSLWGQRFPRFACILAGSDLFARLDVYSAVGSRVLVRIPLDHNTPQRMLEYLGRLHPQLAATDPRILRVIDDAYGHGNWRAWEHLVLTTYDAWEHNGPLTLALAKDAIYQITGSEPALHMPGAHRPQPTRR